MATVAQFDPASRMPKRRWQFSLRTALVVMLVCAVGLALIVVPAERQRRAVNYVESLGGRIIYEEEPNVLRLAPDWLRNVLGADYFQSVEQIILVNTKVSDAGLVHLTALTGLKHLHLGDTQVSDAEIEELERALPNCQILSEQPTSVPWDQ